MRPRADERPDLGDAYAEAYAAAYDRTRLPHQRGPDDAATTENHTTSGPEATAVAAAPSRSRVRWLGWFAIGLVVGSLIGLVVVTRSDDSDSRRSTATTTGRGPGTGTGTVSAGDARVIAGLPPRGSLTRVAVQADGTLRIQEWTRGAGSTGTHRTLAPRGSARLSSSVPGRALAQIAPAPGTTSGPRTVSVTARSVLSLACLPPGELARPCGRPDSAADLSWTVALDREHADETVLAQVDLR